MPWTLAELLSPEALRRRQLERRERRIKIALLFGLSVAIVAGVARIWWLR